MTTRTVRVGLCLVSIAIGGCDQAFDIRERFFDAAPPLVDAQPPTGDAAADAPTKHDGGKPADAHEAAADVPECSPQFTLIAPTSLTLYEQVPVTLQLSSSRCPGFTTPVAVTLGALPAGVSASVMSVNLDVATPSSTITLTAAVGVTFGTTPLQITGQAVSLVPDATAMVSLVIAPLPNGLDRTFNMTGSVDTTLNGNPSVVESLAIDPSDNIVIAGDDGEEGGQGFIVGRYTSSGSLDTTFGGSGITITPVEGDDSGAESVSLQPNGSILVAGDDNPYTDARATQFAAARYTSTGTLDTTFGTNGTVVTPLSYDSPVSAAALEGANYLVVGNDKGGTIDLVRYTSSGVLDSTFGTSGDDMLSPGNMYANAVALTRTGEILVVGGTTVVNNQIVLAELTAAGSLDTTFQTTGYIVTTVGTGATSARGVAVDSSGGIFVCGTTFTSNRNEFFVAAYSSDGAPNLAFGQSGIVFTALGSTDDEASAIAIDAVGNVVVAGTTFNGSNSGAGLVRYTASNGALDTTFGYQGMIRSVDDATFDSIYALAIDHEGNLVVGGTRLVSNTPALLVARYSAQ
jgi:uncharacterized delta-60 repeat protein